MTAADRALHTRLGSTLKREIPWIRGTLRLPLLR